MKKLWGTSRGLKAMAAATAAALLALGGRYAEMWALQQSAERELGAEPVTGDLTIQAEAEERAQDVANRALDMLGDEKGVLPRIVVKHGEPVAMIMEAIADNPDIAALVLGAARGASPGPLVTHPQRHLRPRGRPHPQARRLRPVAPGRARRAPARQCILTSKALTTSRFIAPQE